MGFKTDILEITDKITLRGATFIDAAGFLSQGLSWNETDDTYTRIGSLAGLALGSSAGNANLPIQSQMRRCLMKTAGVVEYYLSATDSTKKEDGVTSAVLDGTDGQVMVEIPKFYYKYSIAVTGGKTIHTWKISAVPLAGFEVHSMFNKAGTEKPFAYIGAYEAGIYDTSATRFANGVYFTAGAGLIAFTSADKKITYTGALTNPFSALEVGDKIICTGTASNGGALTVAAIGDKVIVVTEALTDETPAGVVIVSNQRDYTATTGDKLSSVNAKIPVTQLTRAQARVIALNNGAGWHQQDFNTISGIQLLYLVEFASFYSQSRLGAGITNVGDWATYNDYNSFVPSGNSNSHGNATFHNAGGSTASGEKSKIFSYRGIENFYGHIYKIVDGLNINSNAAYICSNPANFADDATTNYTLLGTLGNADGYQKTLLQNKRGFLPTGVSGGSTTYITDYYYQGSGWRVAFFGGRADLGASAGAFCWSLYYVSGAAFQSVGSRLACS